MSTVVVKRKAGSENSNGQLQASQKFGSDGKVDSFKLSWIVDSEREWDKDELGDVLHWMRQVIALLAGVVWGVIPLVGAIWLALFIALTTVLTLGYYTAFLKVDAEDFGGHAQLLQEGFLSSLGLFLLVWILVYSCLHF